MSDTKQNLPAPTEASPARQIFHTLIAVAGWGVFIYWWFLVLQRVSAREVRFTGLFLAAALVVIVVLTGLWVLHNLSIAKRKGARQQLREATLDYSRDPVGRAVTFEAKPEALQQAPVVQVRVEEGRKTFQPIRPASSKTAA